MLRRLPALAFPMLLAGCATTEAPPPPVAAVSVPAAAAGLDRVMGRPAPALATLFGQAVLDIREGKARKLQYRGPACVLDVYLYPPAGGAPDTATAIWIDARDRKGASFDRASCIAALSRHEPPRRPSPPPRRAR